MTYDPLHLSLSRHDDFLHIQMKFHYLDEGVARQALETLAPQRALGIKRILLEDAVAHWHLTTSGILTLIDSLRFMDLFATRLAIFSTIASHHEDLRFAETAAINRGYEVKAFDEADPAMAWLLRSSD